MEEARFDLEAQNPLLINVVAQRLLQFVPLAHLKNCRLVCKVWWKESLLRWRRTQWLNVTTNDSNSGRWDPHPKHLLKNEERLQKCLFVGTYLNHLSKWGDDYQFGKYPFQKLHLFKCKLRFDDDYWKNGLLKEFCRRCGPYLTSLSIEKCTIYTKDDFNRTIFRFSSKLEYLSLADNIYRAKCSRKNVPTKLDINKLVRNEGDLQSKLTHLKLSMAQTHPTQNDQLPITWTKFFAHFPNNQKLELAKLNEDYGKETSRGFDIENILESIQVLRRGCGILQQLTVLDLLNMQDQAVDISSDILDILQVVSLPLTFFAFDIGFDHDETSRLGDLLQIGAGTLDTLIIYKAPLSLPFGNFPYRNSFPNLTKLTLVGPIVNDLRFLELLEHMPKLRSLRLFHRILYEYPIYGGVPEPKVLTQLRTFKSDAVFPYYDTVNVVERVTVVANTDFSLMAHLTFPNLEEFIIGRELCTGVQVEELAPLMPNVKRLGIGMDYESFRAVCKFWSGLEKLDIHPLLVDDEGFTGIIQGGDPNAARLPNLTDLKKLWIC